VSRYKPPAPEVFVPAFAFHAVSGPNGCKHVARHNGLDGASPFASNARSITRRGVELLTSLPEDRGRFATELGLKSQVRALQPPCRRATAWARELSCSCG